MTQAHHNAVVQQVPSARLDTGCIVQVSVNPSGGVPKYAVQSASVTREGVAGDKQVHRQFHGGPQRAVSLFSLERIEALRTEGHSIGPGTTGENLTVEGLDWDQIKPGTRLLIGDEVMLEITGYATPCEAIRGSFSDERFVRLSQKLYPGWSRTYARVIAEGSVQPGDSVRLES